MESGSEYLKQALTHVKAVTSYGKDLIYIDDTNPYRSIFESGAKVNHNGLMFANDLASEPFKLLHA